MGRLENDPFLTELTKLYTANKDSGTVYVTMKSITSESGKKPKKSTTATTATGGGSSSSSSAKAKDDDHHEALCLMRARAGSDKISTVVRTRAVSAVSWP